MVIWGLNKRTTATTRLGTLYGAGYLTKPKGEKGGMYALADSNSTPNRRRGRQKNSRKRRMAVSTPSAAEENTRENNALKN
jgi:hypothetical protein